MAAKNTAITESDYQKYSCFFFIADYHSLSGDYKPEEKKEQIFNLACDYLAAGLDPKQSRIFVQSQVPFCTELAWVFNTITTTEVSVNKY